MFKLFPYSRLDSDEASSSTDTLLDSEHDIGVAEKQNLTHGLGSKKPSSFLKRNLRSALVHVLLLISNVSISLSIFFSAKADGKIALDDKRIAFDMMLPLLPDGTTNTRKKTNFGGRPRQALTDAWRTYDSYNTLLMQDDWLEDSFNKSTIVRIPGRSGFLGTLAVFHGLHCVERLHHYVYKDHYYPDLSEDEASRLEVHTEHCIDWIRQYVECNADMTPLTMHWEDRKRLPQASNTIAHQCKDFAAVQDWAEQRKLYLSEPGLLVHPKLGVVFKGTPGESKGDRIGI